MLALRDRQTDASGLRVPIHITKVENDFVPTDGTGLPVDRSEDFGTSPFFGQLSGKQNRLAACERYIVSAPMAMTACGWKHHSRCNNCEPRMAEMGLGGVKTQASAFLHFADV